jgi:signal transduction histidine kinase
MTAVKHDRFAKSDTQAHVVGAPQVLGAVLSGAVSADLLTSVLDALPVGIAIIDATDDFRVVHCNPIFERWTPAEKLPLTGKPFSVISGTVENRIIDVLEATVESREPRHFRDFEYVGYPQARVALPGNVTVWNWDLYPIVDCGEVTHLLSVGIDVTDQAVARKALEDTHEEKLQALRGYGERMQELERIKSEFLNLAAHELRGPVTILQGYLSMFQDGSLPSVTGPARDALPTLRARTRHINRLIDDMLDAGRLEEGLIELRLEAVDVGAVAGAVLEMVRPLATAHHELVMREPETPVLIRADSDRLHSILGDLIENAVKYSPAGGDVTCSVSSDGEVATVTVSDQGLGIPEVEMRRLFTRFGRTVRPQTSHIPGSGLGLYLARALARLHGGDVVAASEEGVGSTFTLTLPIEPT